MIFIAIVLIVLVTVAYMLAAFRQAGRVIEFARREWGREPVPWWLPHD